MLCLISVVTMQGVTTLCLELQKLKLTANEDATLYDFAVLDALWSGIVQNPIAMQNFLVSDGLGTLLDVLESGAVGLKPVLLTITAGEKAVGFVIVYCDCSTGCSSQSTAAGTQSQMQHDILPS